MTIKNPYWQRRKSDFDGCQTKIFSDGSIIINTTRKNLLCFDFSEIRTLFREASRLSKTNKSKTRSAREDLFEKHEIQ
jgi:hypothetical protein